MNKPYVVGVTGGIGSGKTAATDYLEKLGGIVIDADVISRSLTAENGAALPKIREQFGDEVFFQDGTLNRAALGNAVFSDKEARHRLECITHPLIQHEIVLKLMEYGNSGVKFVFLSVPLLFETGMDAMCDEVWCVYCSEEEQLRRVMERDGLDAEAARKRIASQMSTAERLEKSTTAIRTDRPMENTRYDIANIYTQLKRRFN